MSHSCVLVWIHVVWGTKWHYPVLAPSVAHVLEQHIHEYAASKEITIDTLAIQPEHVHCLLRLGASQRLDEVVRLLKGESSHWLNLKGLLPGEFSWARGYWAGSIHYEAVGEVRVYIAQQDKRHLKTLYRDELRKLLDEFGLPPTVEPETE